MLSALLFCMLAAGETLHLERLPVTVNRPVALAFAPGENDRVYIVDSHGYIRVAVDGVLEPVPFLDIDAKVTDNIGEPGFIGLAFAPDYQASGNYYVHYIDNKNGNVIAQYNVRARKGHKPKILLRSQAMNYGHCGGKLVFGPDGALYTGIGDGGDKPAAQDMESMRGKLIRFGAVGPEVIAYGLRNPWSFSFDRETGDRWIGNVGDSVYESIYYQAFGDTMIPNHGWPMRDGAWCSAPCASVPADFVPPLLTYYHYAVDPAMQGVCIIGGYVYRGMALPWLQGSYVFADFGGQGKLWAYKDGVVTDLKPLLTSDVPFTSPCAFAEGNDGELWVIDFAGADICKLTP